MLIADVDVLEFGLRRWERDGLVRYYHGWWDKYLKPEQKAEYMAKYGRPLDPFRSGIGVYFDSIGRLHIDNCPDPELYAFLERMMNRWYGYAYLQYVSESTELLKIDALLAGCIKDLKPGFYQIRYDGLVVNLDEKQLARVRRNGVVGYDSRNKRYMIKSTQPRLDEILEAIVKDNNARIQRWIEKKRGNFLYEDLRLRSV